MLMLFNKLIQIWGHFLQYRLRLFRDGLSWKRGAKLNSHVVLLGKKVSRKTNQIEQDRIHTDMWRREMHTIIQKSFMNYWYSDQSVVNLPWLGYVDAFIGIFMDQRDITKPKKRHWSQRVIRLMKKLIIFYLIIGSCSNLTRKF